MNTMTIQRRLAIIGITLLLTGCVNHTFSRLSPGMKMTRMPSLGGVASSHEVLTPADANQFQNFAYVKLNNFSSIKTTEYQDYVLEALLNMGLFKTVAASMPTIHITTPVDNDQVICKKTWYDNKDHYTVNQLRDKYPGQNGLVLDVTLREMDPCQKKLFEFGRYLTFDVKAIDIKTGSTVFYARNQARSWFGADRTVVNPVLNRLRQWMAETQISTQKQG